MTAPGQVVVIGAGPAGIGAALALEQQATVLDSSPELGGLCGTIHFDGAVFDLGGHSFHTPHACVRDLVFQSLDMYRQRRDARCYSHGVLIPYPFQTHFREIGKHDVTEDCLSGLKRVDEELEPANFEEFIQRRFGAGIARHFLLPYNRKLWGTDLSRLAADWAGERVAAANGRPERFAESGGKRTPLASDTMVAYPARGGFGEIMVALAKNVRDLRLGQSVVRIDLQRRQVVLADGETQSWQRVVSTIPIDRLLTLLADVPSSLAADVRQLEVLALSLVLVVVGHPVDTPIQRIYCADPQIPAHKITLNHNSSPYLRGLSHHGIVAEVSHSADKAISHADLERRILQTLLDMNLVKSLDDVRATKVVDVPYAYPVPTHRRDETVRRVKTWLEERGIHTLGRFGEWAYINSDEALYRGLQLGRALAEQA